MVASRILCLVLASLLVVPAPVLAATISGQFAPVVRACAAGQFFFDGACRSDKWINATFGGGLVLGNTNRTGGDRLLYVDPGDEVSVLYYVTSDTLPPPPRIKSRYQAAPSRPADAAIGGYRVERRVEVESIGFAEFQVTESVLIPAGAGYAWRELVTYAHDMSRAQLVCDPEIGCYQIYAQDPNGEGFPCFEETQALVMPTMAVIAALAASVAVPAAGWALFAGIVGGGAATVEWGAKYDEFADCMKQHIA